MYINHFKADVYYCSIGECCNKSTTNKVYYDINDKSEPNIIFLFATYVFLIYLLASKFYAVGKSSF